MLVVNSLCKNIFLIFLSKFPVFSLSGKMDFQIPWFPCFPCAVATLKENIDDIDQVLQGARTRMSRKGSTRKENINE